MVASNVGCENAVIATKKVLGDICYYLIFYDEKKKTRKSLESIKLGKFWVDYFLKIEIISYKRKQFPVPYV